MHNVRCRLYIAMSLDGYIADRDGGVEWLEPFRDLDYGFPGFLDEISTVVMGRRAWEQSFRSRAEVLQGKRVIVLTRRPVPDAPDYLETSDGGAHTLWAGLRRDNPWDVWVAGGASVVEQFLIADELDEIELFVMPVLLGAGVSLFPGLDTPCPLRLVDTREYANGVVHMRYERPREYAAPRAR